MDCTILAITDSGCEEACATEIARWVQHKVKQHRNVVELKGSLDDAVLLAYHLQTARRVLIQLVPPLQQADDIEKRQVAAELLTGIFPKELTFKVEVDVLSLDITQPSLKKEDGTSEAAEDETTEALVHPQELIEAVGGWAHDTLARKVQLKKPDITLYAVATPERIWIGIDLIGRPLAKRDWRIMLSRKSLKATVAAATVIYACAKEDETILDPLGDDGTIGIEATFLFTRTSQLRFTRDLSFEKFPALAGRDWKKWREERRRSQTGKITAYAANMRELKAIRTNAKLAGIEKDIHTTRVDMEWVETKFEESTIDRIITSPIASGKSIAEKTAGKLADELFYQAEYVLKKGKTLTAISEKPDELLEPAKKYGFTLLWRRDVFMGQRRMTIISFKNGKRKEE